MRSPPFSSPSSEEHTFINRWVSYRFIRLEDWLVRYCTTCIGLYFTHYQIGSHLSVVPAVVQQDTAETLTRVCNT